MTSGSKSPDHVRACSSFVNASPVAQTETPKERSYVPKEKQLEKLRQRMEEERKKKGRAVIGLGVEVEKTHAAVLDI